MKQKKPKTEKTTPEAKVYDEAILSGRNKPAIKPHTNANPGKNEAALAIITDDNVEIQRGLYSDEILPKLEVLCAQGLNNNQLAKALNIGNRTFYEWLKRYPQFLFSIYKYRGVNDVFVENALYNTAVGYTYVEQVVSPLGGVVSVNRYMPGSAAAQKFYLTNRMQERYKNKVETTLKVGDNVSAVAVVIRRREE